MKLDDRVYGKEEIKEQVLIDLISCKSVQRLRGLAQYGLPDRYYHKKNFSRYEHSIGVMIFLRQLGAYLNEQIAGLLHDVSHTSFSHIGDWIFGTTKEENFQDLNHEKFLSDSDIPRILLLYNINPSYISKIDNFKLLERKRPELCADRIDFSLREIFYRFDKYYHESVLDDLVVFEGNFGAAFGNTDITEFFDFLGQSLC